MIESPCVLHITVKGKVEAKLATCLLKGDGLCDSVTEVHVVHVKVFLLDWLQSARSLLGPGVRRPSSVGARVSRNVNMITRLAFNDGRSLTSAILR